MYYFVTKNIAKDLYTNVVLTSKYLWIANMWALDLKKNHVKQAGFLSLCTERAWLVLEMTSFWPVEWSLEEDHYTVNSFSSELPSSSSGMPSPSSSLSLASGTPSLSSSSSRWSEIPSPSSSPAKKSQEMNHWFQLFTKQWLCSPYKCITLSLKT